MKTEHRIVIAGVVLAMLSACGAKGPLFLPEKAAPVEVPVETTTPEEAAPAGTSTDLPAEPPIEPPAETAAQTTPATND